MQFIFDPHKDELNVRKHGNSLDQASVVFNHLRLDLPHCAGLQEQKGLCMSTGSKLTNRKSTPKVNDWKLVKKQVEADEPIAFDPEVDPYDPNDEAAVKAFWASATITRGRGRPPVSVKRPTLNMRVDAEVLEAFKATGPGWQTRINSLLRDAVKSGAVKSVAVRS